jgi:hypothetical protein
MTVAAAADLTLYRLGPDDFGVISAIRRVWDAAGQVSEKTRSAGCLVCLAMRKRRVQADRVDRLSTIVKVTHCVVNVSVSMMVEILGCQYQDDLAQDGVVQHDAAKHPSLTF